MDLNIGNQSLRVVTTESGGRWTAHAVRTDTGERFGIETSSADREDAATRLLRWLEWQAEHMQALTALQQAERDYHRATTDAAFASASEPGGAVSLEAVNVARQTLDDIRARRPRID